MYILSPSKWRDNENFNILPAVPKSKSSPLLMITTNLPAVPIPNHPNSQGTEFLPQATGSSRQMQQPQDFSAAQAMELGAAGPSWEICSSLSLRKWMEKRQKCLHFSCSGLGGRQGQFL
jgi:hypothetical protein